MTGKTAESDPLIELSPKGNLAYGCLFCHTGKEQIIASCIEHQERRIRARAVCQTKRYTSNGKTTLQNEVALPGYVLIEAPEQVDIFKAVPNDEFISILTYSDGDWRLFGDDEEYAKWVFRHDGLISLSKAHKVGDRIQIIEGPLKDIEGMITRVDRRNQSGQVTLNFGGKQLKVWLGFEIIEEQAVHERTMGS